MPRSLFHIDHQLFLVECAHFKLKQILFHQRLNLFLVRLDFIFILYAQSVLVTTFEHLPDEVDFVQPLSVFGMNILSY